VAAEPAAAPDTRVASAAPAQSEGFFSSLAHKIGLGSDEAAPAARTTAPAPSAKPKVAAKPSEPRAAPAAPNWTPKPADSKVAAAKPPLKPSSVADDAAAVASPFPAPPATNLIAGSQPVVSANSFDSRWQAVH
jgi:hypothetical protein